MKREVGFTFRLSEEELEQLRQLAYLHDRSMSNLLRMWLRQAANKAELPAKRRKQEAAEYA